MSCVPDATRTVPASRNSTLPAAGNPAATHVGRRPEVASGAAEFYPQVRHAVLEGRRLTAILVIVVKHRPVIAVVVLKRDELALRRRAEPHALLGAGAMTDRLKHHLAAEH